MLDRQEMLFLDFLVIVTKHVNSRNTQKGLVFYVFNNLRYVFNNLRYVFSIVYATFLIFYAAFECSNDTVLNGH